jgi:hypothetical protein
VTAHKTAAGGKKIFHARDKAAREHFEPLCIVSGEGIAVLDVCWTEWSRRTMLK